MHAKLLEHSELLTHSGRQLGGEPTYSFKHEHDGESPIGRHSEFGPHGDGWQGFVDGVCNGVSGIGWHLINGSPVYFGKQLQIGL
jgi:hypothetical protein